MTDDVAALQQALAGEHSVIWAYGDIGAAVSDAHLAAVQAADEAHRAHRGQLEDLIRALGQEPVPSEPAYTLPAPVSDDASALTLAAALEDSMAAQWRHCCGRVDSPQLRAFCVDALATAATAALRWRQTAGAGVTVPAFPGQA